MLDCKGLACPQPVMRTKDLLEKEAPETVEVLVDNQAAGQNVQRFLQSQGYEAEVAAQGGDFVISGRRDPGKVAQTPPPDIYTCSPEDARTLVFVRSDTLGRGDDKLGAGLMKNFLLTLKEMGPSLWRILFLNSGVKLCCQGSESLPALQELVDSGVSILVCGTCLDFYGLLDEKQVGETTNMLDIVTSLQVAGKVVTV
ncbi:MAG: sulfurtransferase-like selenium metabolism protein YedF [Proteobacteria bacterium]|nr:sulfurtransferase-like selenium metabolism protein YedF [Pseudomonadota bacterium]MBU4383099.1 sulfurtransferase-like selenium metabolism protein YedF [Pseudomonadota bacterium]MBU4604171.1 sulfurtransferase-like selenium metabolism protein YedF [Pseudomonadota bacterium]MCG2762797.1 sulfurtransferase-like selenium metabolism protein YedF [Desulfarculaceae bacterium]